MFILKKIKARKAAREKFVLIVGAALGSAATFVAMKLLGKAKCLCCFKRLLAKKK